MSNCSCKCVKIHNQENKLNPLKTSEETASSQSNTNMVNSSKCQDVVRELKTVLLCLSLPLRHKLPHWSCWFHHEFKLWLHDRFTAAEENFSILTHLLTCLRTSVFILKWRWVGGSLKINTNWKHFPARFNSLINQIMQMRGHGMPDWEIS